MTLRSASAGAALLACSLLPCLTGCKKDPAVEKQKYLESGERYLKDGKYREAGIQFQNAIKIDKNFSKAHYDMSKVYLQLGIPMSGYQELMRTVDLDPANQQARIDLGSLMVAGGVPDRALDQAKAVLALNANNPDAYALRAQVEHAKKDDQAALADVQHALSLDPNRSGFHAMLAVLQGTSGQPAATADAKAELQKAVALDPSNSNAHLALASLLVRSGDRGAAEKELQQAIQSAPKSVELRASLASFYFQDHDEAHATETLYAAASEMPENQAAVSILKDYYLQNKRVNDARTAYAKLTEAHPKSIPLKIAYAQVLLQAGDKAAAKSIVDSISKTDSKNPQVQMLNAFFLLNDHKIDEAYTLLQKATHDSPENVPLQVMLGRTALQKGDSNTAEAAFRAANQLDSSNLEAAKGLALIASSRNDSSLLSQVAESTIGVHPNFADAYLWRGTAAANQKEWAHAQADFETARKLDPQNTKALTLLGKIALAQGKTAEAKGDLEQAFQQDPNNLEAITPLVQSDLSAKQPAAALARVQSAIQRSPNNGRLYTLQSLVELLTRNFPAARDSAQKAMQLDATDESAVQAYSQALVAMGQTDQALNTWQTWSQAHPNDAKAVLLLGTLEEARGDTGKALDYYKKVIQLKPNDPVASNNLAYLTVETGGNTDVALNYAQVARHGLPDSPDTADTLAWVYYHKASYALARDLLEDAVKQSPGSASIQYHLGATYAKLGDKANALTHLKQAATMAPDTKAGKDAAAAAAQLG